MKSLATAFKEVYGEALKEYGFKKVKGKYPYYARMVGDEIVQVITYKEEWCAAQNKKAFSVMGGIATVYRKKIAFDESPKDNAEWLVGDFDIYINYHKGDFVASMAESIRKIEYEKENEQSLINAINWSLEISKDNILKSLESVNSLEQCILYYLKYKPSLLRIWADERYIKKWIGGSHNEGLLYIKVYGFSDYKHYEEDQRMIMARYNEMELDSINSGRSGLTLLEYERDRVDRLKEMNEKIDEYKILLKNQDYNVMIVDELQKRKNDNLLELIKMRLL